MSDDPYSALWTLDTFQHWQEREEEIERRQRRIEQTKLARRGLDDEWGNDGD